MSRNLPIVTSVRVVRDRVLYLTFDDGVAGEIDLTPDLWGPVFDGIRDDDDKFAEVYVDEDEGTVNWPPGDLDLAAHVLHDDILAEQGAEPTMPQAIPRVTSVRVVRDRVLHLTFDDGVTGEVDLAPDLWGPIFDSIRENDGEFAKVYVDPETATINWPPGDLDLAPEVLHEDIVAGRRRPARR